MVFLASFKSLIFCFKSFIRLLDSVQDIRRFFQKRTPLVEVQQLLL